MNTDLYAEHHKGKDFDALVWLLWELNLVSCAAAAWPETHHLFCTHGGDVSHVDSHIDYMSRCCLCAPVMHAPPTPNHREWWASPAVMQMGQAPIACARRSGCGDGEVLVCGLRWRMVVAPVRWRPSTSTARSDEHGGLSLVSCRTAGMENLINSRGR